MVDDILNLSASKILKLYEGKELSPVDVVKASFRKIEEHNPTYNAYNLIADEGDCLKQAKLSEQRWFEGKPMGRLDGLPTSIKDETEVKGWATRHGSLTTSDAPAESDSPCVTRLRKAGALFIGKTTTPEFGHKGVTDSLVTGITRNPWNKDKTSGGSSGGAAVAAATHMGLLHLGSDGGGSIRIPSSFCGVFGIKPSTGTVPETQPAPFSTISTLGPIAKTVEDASLMLDVITEPEPTNWNAPPHSQCCSFENLKILPTKMKVAYVPTINDVSVDPEIASFLKTAADKMDGFSDVEEISLSLPSLIDVFDKHWMAIASWIKKQIPEKDHDKMDPYLLSFCERGEKLTLDEYMNAEVERMVICNKIKSIFTKYDLIILPTMAMTAFDVGQNEFIDESGNPQLYWTPFTFIANLTKCPAASLPCGITKDGMPAGVQLMGNYLNDELVMQASYRLEQELAFKSLLSEYENKKVA